MNNDEDFIAGVIIGGLSFGLMIFILISLFKNDQIDNLKNDAAQKGCAEYYLDEKHQSQWRWTK